jgi:2-oxo-4-hydroxy-4-carboxy--5-ureidoimidazoline (OHCU) decarboxylase
MTGKLNIVGSNTDTEMTKRKSNENLGAGLGQTQNCDSVKLVNSNANATYKQYFRYIVTVF